MFKLSKLLFVVIFTITTSITLIGCSTQAPITRSDQALLNMDATQRSLLVWANEAATSAFSYNYVTYRHDLEIASNYFTPEAWNAFRLSLEHSKNLDKVIKEKMVVSAVAEGSPVILNQFITTNKQTWIVQMPLLVSYQNANVYEKGHYIVTMHIINVPPAIGYRGFAIDQFITERFINHHGKRTLLKRINAP